MKRVLVTGTEGEVGRVLLPQLAKRFDASGIDLRPPSAGVRAVQGDLTDYDQVAAVVKGCEAVVHMAALLPGRGKRDPADSVDANVKATAVLLQACVQQGVRRFVYCSTVWASGHGFTEPCQPIDAAVPCAPVCIYGQTKWLGELMCDYYGRQHGIETVVIRFCGFAAAKGYAADGRIDWAGADVKAFFLRYLGAGFKLMNPVDLGTAFGQAVDVPGIAGERFVVGCYTPYQTVDAAALRSMPAAVVEKYYPGVPAFLKGIGIEIPPAAYYFDHENARTRLGFRSQHDLGDLVRLYSAYAAAK